LFFQGLETAERIRQFIVAFGNNRLPTVTFNHELLAAEDQMVFT
jgi:hypothetical protein